VRPLVLDTNIVLDLFVFADERVQALHAALREGSFDWLATQAMRDELACVLRYPNLAARADASEVLGAFDAGCRIVDVPAPALMRCTDEDDQKFIDLAVAHGSLLLSKDKAVLKMRKRLAKAGVECWGSLCSPPAYEGCAGFAPV
jgi:predicted nucleic acid-binding protein